MGYLTKKQYSKAIVQYDGLASSSLIFLSFIKIVFFMSNRVTGKKVFGEKIVKLFISEDSYMFSLSKNAQATFVKKPKFKNNLFSDFKH